MKYFIRSVKYFFYLLVILAIIITILVLAGFVEADISKIFVNGYDSLWQICLIMAVFAAIYPRFGFSSRTAHVYGSPEDVRPLLLKVMDLHGYRLEKDGGDSLTFVKRSVISRLLKMWEDRITVSFPTQFFMVSRAPASPLYLTATMTRSAGETSWQHSIRNVFSCPLQTNTVPSYFSYLSRSMTKETLSGPFADAI